MGSAHQKASPLVWAGSKGAAELNSDTINGHNEVRDGIAGEGQGLSEENEYRINGVAVDINKTHLLDAAVVTHNHVLEKLQNQSPAPVVLWERFLPLRTLKVLLVENDDSTRHVVSALLRNCCYEVMAVANGLEAWRVLADPTNRIDLVLTEVVMPSLSGIGLLCKIMSHKTCMTIPVIMMSSNDSMGIVFKCLSKGAVDFLVKPIRKNELKNLWQHVWRRCHIPSGGGSESGIGNQKISKSKSEDDSDNNTGSNDETDNGSIGLNARDGSDNGSGTQSTLRKRAVEVDSPPPQPTSPSDEIAAPHDSLSRSTDLPENGPDKNQCHEDNESMELSSIELSLKRLRSGREDVIPSSYERSVFRRSNLSAFSRYPTSLIKAPPRGYGASSINVVKSGMECNYPASAFVPLQPPHSSSIQPVIIDEVQAVQYHHHHYHHHHHHVHAFQAEQQALGTAAYSLNESNSGSNGQNGCITTSMGGTNMEIGIGGGNGNGDRSSRREAALNKFRQKRNARNFGKMVRYQSRQRLAEQRPRVRGQFVRRIIHNEIHQADG